MNPKAVNHIFGPCSLKAERLSVREAPSKIFVVSVKEPIMQGAATVEWRKSFRKVHCKVVDGINLSTNWYHTCMPGA